MANIEIMPAAPDLKAAIGKTYIKLGVMLQRPNIRHPLGKFIKAFLADNRFTDAV